jgi:hypothetical protein
MWHAICTQVNEGAIPDSLIGNLTFDSCFLAITYVLSTQMRQENSF